MVLLFDFSAMLLFLLALTDSFLLTYDHKWRGNLNMNVILWHLFEPPVGKFRWPSTSQEWLCTFLVSQGKAVRAAGSQSGLAECRAQLEKSKLKI
jgi:hypothetical protein